MSNQQASGLRPVDEALLEALRADQRRLWMKYDEITAWRPGLRAPKVWLIESMAPLARTRTQGQVVASAKKLCDAGLLERDPVWKLYRLVGWGLPDRWPHPLDLD